MAFFVVTTYPDGHMFIERRPWATLGEAETQASAQATGMDQFVAEAYSDVGGDWHVTVVEADDVEAARDLFPGKEVSIGPVSWSATLDGPILWRWPRKP